MKILIAYDESICADDAIDDLPRAGLPRDADTMLMSVQERWTSTSAVSVMPGGNAVSTISVAARRTPDTLGRQLTNISSLEKKVELASKRIFSFFPEWNIETVVSTGSPAREINRRAKLINADLIVLGSNGRTKSKRFALGSVAQKVSNEASCSVRVVRGQAWKNGSPSRLLIGIDGSLSSNGAVEEVARRMWITGGEVRLITVRDAFENNYQRVCSYLEVARKILEEADFTVTELIEDGDPKQIIVSSAEEWGADCIFLGANSEENSAENSLLGGVASAIIARAHCNVEIVRHKAG